MKLSRMMLIVCVLTGLQACAKTSAWKQTAQLKQEETRRDVRVRLKGGSEIAASFISADSETLQIEDQTGSRVIRIDEVASIAFDSGPEETSAKEAIKALRKVAGATEVGVSLMQYGPLVIEARAGVDDALTQTSNERLREEISLAMEAYADAGRAWNQMIEYDFLLLNSRIGSSIQKKYDIPFEPGEIGGGSMSKNAVLRTIWKNARLHLDQASRMLSEK